MTPDLDTVKAFAAWFFNNPATGIAVLFVGWRLKSLGEAILKALDTLNDPDKTAARLKPLFDEQRKDIVEDVNHDIRAIVHAAIFRRDGNGS